MCAEHKKPKKLLKHLEEIFRTNTGRNPPRVLVFANRVKTVRFLHNLLKQATLRVAMLHGERSQPEREVRIPRAATQPGPGFVVCIHPSTHPSVCARAEDVKSYFTVCQSALAWC